MRGCLGDLSEHLVAMGHRKRGPPGGNPAPRLLDRFFGLLRLSDAGEKLDQGNPGHGRLVGKLDRTSQRFLGAAEHLLRLLDLLLGLGAVPQHALDLAEPEVVPEVGRAGGPLPGRFQCPVEILLPQRELRRHALQGAGKRGLLLPQSGDQPVDFRVTLLLVQELDQPANGVRVAPSQVERLEVVLDGRLRIAFELVNLPGNQRDARPFGAQRAGLGQVFPGLPQQPLLALRGQPPQSHGLTVKPERPFSFDLLDLLQGSLHARIVFGGKRQLEQEKPDLQVVGLLLGDLVPEPSGLLQVAGPQRHRRQSAPEPQPVCLGELLALLGQLPQAPGRVASAAPGQVLRAGQAQGHAVAQLLSGFVQESSGTLPRALPLGQVRLRKPVYYLVLLLLPRLLQPPFRFPHATLGNEDFRLENRQHGRIGQRTGRLLHGLFGLPPITLRRRKAPVLPEQQTGQLDPAQRRSPVQLDDLSLFLQRLVEPPGGQQGPYQLHPGRDPNRIGHHGPSAGSQLLFRLAKPPVTLRQPVVHPLSHFGRRGEVGAKLLETPAGPQPIPLAALPATLKVPDQRRRMSCRAELIEDLAGFLQLPPFSNQQLGQLPQQSPVAGRRLQALPQPGDRLVGTPAAGLDLRQRAVHPRVLGGKLDPPTRVPPGLVVLPFLQGGPRGQRQRVDVVRRQSQGLGGLLGRLLRPPKSSQVPRPQHVGPRRVRIRLGQPVHPLVGLPGAVQLPPEQLRQVPVGIEPVRRAVDRRSERIGGPVVLAGRHLAHRQQLQQLAVVRRRRQQVLLELLPRVRVAPESHGHVDQPPPDVHSIRLRAERPDERFVGLLVPGKLRQQQAKLGQRVVVVGHDTQVAVKIADRPIELSVCLGGLGPLEEELRVAPGLEPVQPVDPAAQQQPAQNQHRQHAKIHFGADSRQSAQPARRSSQECRQRKQEKIQPVSQHGPEPAQATTQSSEDSHEHTFSQQPPAG